MQQALQQALQPIHALLTNLQTTLNQVQATLAITSALAYNTDARLYNQFDVQVRMLQKYIPDHPPGQGPVGAGNVL
jgi:hypothetical protein